MNIYVGNLIRSATEGNVREMFEAFGEVADAKLIMDRYTGESRGFGFVEMPQADHAKAAIEELNGKDHEGRTLTVNEARPRQDNRGGGGRQGGGRQGGGGFRKQQRSW